MKIEFDHYCYDFITLKTKIIASVGFSKSIKVIVYKSKRAQKSCHKCE